MLFLIVACSILIAMIDLASPYLTAKFVDEVLVSKDKSIFNNFIMFLLIIGILAVIMNWFRSIFSAKIRMKVNNELLEDMIYQIQRLPLVFIFNTDMVYLSKRIDNDVNDVVSFVINSIAELCIHSAILFTASFLLLSVKAKWLIIFLVIAVLHIAVYKVLKKKLFELSVTVRETDSQYFSEFSNNFLYAYSIKLHSLYEEYIARFKDSFANYFVSAIHAMKLDFWFKTSLVNANEIFKVLIFWLGGLDVLDNQMSIGSFIALNGYYILAMQGVSYFMEFGQSYQTSLAAYARIMEIKNLYIESNGIQQLTHINSIEVKNINYYFGEFEVIHNLTILFQPGKIYCIVGKNGAGKSTLINLICGLLNPINGEIKYNGIDIHELDMITIRRNLISAVEQKDFLKNDNLSGGERRKLSNSNALLKNSDVLIMDEPDNNLDAENTVKLIDDIVAGKENRITIIISHDKRIINIADEIIDLSANSFR